MTDFTPENWFWIVGGDEARFYSSAERGYVQNLPQGAGVTRIASEDELWDVLTDVFPEGIPVNNGPANRRRDRLISKVDQVVLRVMFNHENRLRNLESRPQINMQQFKNGLRDIINGN